MDSVTVIKRNNIKELFSTGKIISVVRAAGLTEKQSRLLANTISSWVKSRHLKQISSREIRDWISRELKTMDPYAADLYNWYQKTKNPPAG